MPEDEVVPEQFSIGTASCQNYEDNEYAAYADVAAADLDCLVFLGDYIYEGASRPIGTNGSVRVHGTSEPATLAGYRARYELYKRDSHLQAAHASCPWFIIWDDHEVQNNYAGDVPADGSDPTVFRTRRDAAYRAWWEHMPVRLPEPVPGEDYTIYRSARIGKLVDMSLLDTRQYRSDQACGDTTMSLEPACPEVTAPGRKLLGDAQEGWLFSRLGVANATWNVLAEQIVMTNTSFGDTILNFDQWDGYPEARDRLLGYVADLGVENLIVLSGDIHFAGAAQLRVAGGLDSPVVGVEFITTSISSAGNVDPALAGLKELLPDVVDVELTHRGWTHHTVTPDAWTAEFRIVDDAKDPESTSSTWKIFEVRSGRS
ncbi:MAG: alkaline phosphatase D family protein, partial [Ilumatobacteraceae bacterium]